MDMAAPPAPADFHRHLDLARAAHASEVSQLLHENERLKEQVRLLNHQSQFPGPPHELINAGSVGNVRISEDDARSTLSTASDAIPSEADRLMPWKPSDLAEIVLLERDPWDTAPQAETKSASAGASKEVVLKVTGIAQVERDLGHSGPQEEARTTVAGTSKQARCTLSEITNVVLLDDSQDHFYAAAANWEKMTYYLLQVWNSESAVIHLSWQLTLDALSELMTRDEQFAHHMSERFLEERCENENAWAICSCELFSPDSGFSVTWILMGMLLCLYDIVMFPLRLIDLSMSREYGTVANLIVIIFWTIDVLISMTTGYHTKQGYKETRHWMILRRYAKTWMLVDISIVTFDWLNLALRNSSNASVRDVSRMMRIARLVRVGRLLKLGPSIIKLVGQLHSEFMFTMAKLAASIIMLLILNHYIACMFYATWNVLESECSTELHCYLVSLHWAIAHASLGPLDVMPSNEFERFFSIAVLVCSMIIFATFVSANTTAIIHLSDLRSYRVKQESLVRRFFDENRISRELSTRIWTFIWKHNYTGKHRLRTSDVHCFTFLPDHLLAEIRVETFLPILLVHPLFEFCNGRCPEAVMKLCTAGVEQVVVRPSEEMLWTMSADIRSMLFVVDGFVVYKPTWDPNWNQQDLLVSKNMWACEAALWCQNAAVYGPLLGGPAGADVVLVSAREFQEIMRGSSLRFLLSEYAKAFVQRFNECSHDESNADLLFNDADMIKSMVISLKAKKKERRSSAGVWLTALMQGITMRATHGLFAHRSSTTQIAE